MPAGSYQYYVHDHKNGDMMSEPLLTFLGGIFGTLGTILVAYWVNRRTSETNQQQARDAEVQRKRELDAYIDERMRGLMKSQQERIEELETTIDELKVENEQAQKQTDSQNLRR